MNDCSLNWVKLYISSTNVCFILTVGNSSRSSSSGGLVLRISYIFSLALSSLVSFECRVIFFFDFVKFVNLDDYPGIYVNYECLSLVMVLVFLRSVAFVGEPIISVSVVNFFS